MKIRQQPTIEETLRLIRQDMISHISNDISALHEALSLERELKSSTQDKSEALKQIKRIRKTIKNRIDTRNLHLDNIYSIYEEYKDESL